jgi:hypothetical protein
LKVKCGLVWLIMLLFAGSIKADDPVFHGGARSQGMANAQVMLSGENAVMGNHAGLASLSCLTLGAHYENCFMIPELGLGGFYLGLPVRSGVFGLTYSDLGNQFYRQGRACLSFGKAFGGIFRAGIGMHYLWIRQPADMGNLSTLVPALGIQVEPAQGFTVGCQVFNPAAQQFVPAGYMPVPTIFLAGVGFHLGEEILICLETRKQSMERFRYCGGIEIDLHRSISGRFGVSSGAFPGYAFGLGIQVKPFTVDISAIHHPVLGFSTSLTLSLAKEIGKRKIHKQNP